MKVATVVGARPQFIKAGPVSRALRPVQAGWNTLAGADTERICGAVRLCQLPANRPLLYGDGRTARLCVDVIDTSSGHA